MTLVVCVASGPSFSEDQARLIREARDAEKCRVLVVNRSWERIRNADVLYAADARWWRHYWPDVEKGFAGECWCCDLEIAKEFGLCHVHVRARSAQTGDGIESGGNGGYQLLGLARKFLREWREPDPHIVLVGYDMQFADGKPNGRKHWHADYPTTTDAKGRKQTHWGNASGVKQWVGNFNVIARELKADGIRVTNATAETALQCWPRARLEDVLAAL